MAYMDYEPVPCRQIPVKFIQHDLLVSYEHRNDLRLILRRENKQRYRFVRKAGL